ncbi:MAG: hypothetical protein QG657_1820, partial [Acidobacteriota bacterium]|nr:hypothetical protein [Acidobacteriota bacterium]
MIENFKDLIHVGSEEETLLRQVDKN